MLTRLSPIQFDRPTTSGRTRPSIVTCETPAGDTVEVVAKFSGGCDEGVTNLAREVIAACLAGDLGLPIPEPFLIDVTQAWTTVVPDVAQRQRIQSGSPVAFGSRLVTGQYAIWSQGNRIVDAMLPTAAAVFVFDAITQNADRRVTNPNCLVKGDEIRIFDHEMTFTHGLVIGWKPPWVLGGLSVLGTPGFHIFRDQLRGRAVDFEPIRASWSALSDARITAYSEAVPGEWAAAGDAVRRATQLIRDARDNIEGCLTEVQRMLE